MALAAGTALAHHSPPPPPPPPPAADALVCSQNTNGGTLVNGVCILPAATLGQQYEAFIFSALVDGGDFTVVSGSIPPGLQMPALYGVTGTIVGGTPTQQGTFTFTVHDLDPQGATLVQTYSITVTEAPFTLGEAGDTSGSVGQFFLQNIFVSGGIGPYSGAVTSGQLPPGLTLNTSPGMSITGTPTATGTFTFTITSVDGSGGQAALRESITIS